MSEKFRSKSHWSDTTCISGQGNPLENLFLYCHWYFATHEFVTSFRDILYTLFSIYTGITKKKDRKSTFHIVTKNQKYNYTFNFKTISSLTLINFHAIIPIFEYFSAHNNTLFTTTFRNINYPFYKGEVNKNLLIFIKIIPSFYLT